MRTSLAHYPKHDYLLAAFTINASGASLLRQIYTISSGFQLSISPKAIIVPIQGISTSSRGNPKPPIGVISVTRNLSCNNKMISPTLTGSIIVMQGRHEFIIK